MQSGHDSFGRQLPRYPIRQLERHRGMGSRYGVGNTQVSDVAGLVGAWGREEGGIWTWMSLWEVCEKDREQGCCIWHALIF